MSVETEARLEVELYYHLRLLNFPSTDIRELNTQKNNLVSLLIEGVSAGVGYLAGGVYGDSNKLFSMSTRGIVVDGWDGRTVDGLAGWPEKIVKGIRDDPGWKVLQSYLSKASPLAQKAFLIGGLAVGSITSTLVDYLKYDRINLRNLGELRKTIEDLIKDVENITLDVVIPKNEYDLPVKVLEEVRKVIFKAYGIELNEKKSIFKRALEKVKTYLKKARNSKIGEYIMKLIKNAGLVYIAYVVLSVALSVIGHIYALNQIPSTITSSKLTHWSNFAKFHISSYVHNIDSALTQVSSELPKAVGVYGAAKAGEIYFDRRFRRYVNLANEEIDRIKEEVIPDFYRFEPKTVRIPNLNIIAIPRTDLVTDSS